MLTAIASDSPSGIIKYEFYIDGEKIDTQTITDEKATYTWNGTEMVENKNCLVRVFDASGNYEESSCSSRTLLHTWEKYNLDPEISAVVETNDYIIPTTGFPKVYDNMGHSPWCLENNPYKNVKVSVDGNGCGWQWSKYGFKMTISGNYKTAGSDTTFANLKVYDDKFHYFCCNGCGSGGNWTSASNYVNKGHFITYYETVKYKAPGPKGEKLETLTATSETAYVKGASGDYWFEYKGTK